MVGMGATSFTHTTPGLNSTRSSFRSWRASVLPPQTRLPSLSKLFGGRALRRGRRLTGGLAYSTVASSLGGWLCVIAGCFRLQAVLACCAGEANPCRGRASVANSDMLCAVTARLDEVESQAVAVVGTAN
jgi:hypothetical protein